MQTFESTFQIKISSTAGVLKHTVTDYKDMAIRKKVNAAGVLAFTIDFENEAIQYMVADALVEVWRKVINTTTGETVIDWTREWNGVFKDYSIKFIENQYFFNAVCVGDMALLSGREILYYAGTTGKTKFTGQKAETIMKDLVKYNAGSSATTGNGRIRTGTITGLSVEADSARGNTLNFSCAWENLLESLQKIAKVGGADFDLVKTGVAAWEFRYYPGQLGTDRTASVVFSLDRGNMKNPELLIIRSLEKTAIAVLGAGEESSRRIRVVTGANYSATNDIEEAYDARNETDTDAALDSRGAVIAKEKEKTVALEFEIVQTEGARYGQHYFLGDLVTAIFAGYSETLKVTAVEISSSVSDVEQIFVEVSNV